MILREIHRHLIKLTDRAERIDSSVIAQSFVDAEPLIDILSSENNQVIFGRRGTGKTHALRFLANKIRDDSEIALYIDLREIGSNGTIYSDHKRPIAERATRLVQDILVAIHDEILSQAYNSIENTPNPD